MTWTVATNSRPEERNLPLSKLGYGAGTPNLVEQVLLLLDGMDGGKMDLHLGHHFHSPRVFFRSVEKRYIDLADIHPRAVQGQKGINSVSEIQ